MSRLNLKDLSQEGLLLLVEGFGEKPFRARQLYVWLFKKAAEDVGSMTDIPKEFRERLKQEGYYVGDPEIRETAVSTDGTVKLLLKLEDSSLIECVLIPGAKRLTLCISTQTGCALACKFCMTGMIGAGRNLTLSELAGQVHAAMGLVRQGLVKGHDAVTNVVLMGMGEPLLNYDEVVGFLRVLTDQNGMQFPSKRVTVSTAGIVPAIEKLGRDANVGLAVSLNATTDKVRDRLMPINKKYPIAKLISALREYPLKKRRYITFEYVLIKDINDTDEDATRLSRLLRGIPSKINLIPFNPFPGSAFKRPEDARIKAFKQILHEAGYNVNLRISKGADIHAACGQLRGGRK